MSVLRRSRIEDGQLLERKLRFAVVGLLDFYGDGEVIDIEAIVAEAHADWMTVNG